MFLSDVSIKRPVFATMMMVLLVVLGVVSYRRLAVDEYPDITRPTLSVNASFRGASPQVMEREIARPIEEAVNTVQDVMEVNSNASEGSANVRVTFNLNADIGAGMQDIQARVSAIRRSLPAEMEEISIRRFDPNDRPIMQIAIQSSARHVSELTDVAEEVIKTRLESVTGVGEVNVSGGAPRQIKIELNPEALREYGVTSQQIATAVQRENQEVPAGRIERGDMTRAIRILGRIKEPRAFEEVVVTTRGGIPIRVGDIGKVRDAAEQPRSGSFVNGERAVSLDVLKISGSNTVEVADGVRAAVERLQNELPEDIRFTLIRDDSQRIRESLADVQITMLLGAILTIAIIYLFLNSWRSTVITGLTLPISIISAFFVMWVCNFSINTMTLMALSLAIGLLIDDAIVVRENIVRHLEMGKDHYKAAKDGTDEIGLAVISTSLAVVAVFVPVAFMGGQIGKMFFQFGVTVAFAVLVSLFVSFTLDPMLSSVWHDPDVEPGHENRKAGPIHRVAIAFNRVFDRIADEYPRWLKWGLHHRMTVLAGAAASVIAAAIIIPRLGFTWMPEIDGGEFTVNYRTFPGARVEYSLEKGKQLAEMIRKEIPEVNFTYLNVGGGFMGTSGGGSVLIKLKPKDERTRDQFAIQTELRQKMTRVPGIRPSITGTQTIFGGGMRQPIQIFVQGPEQSRLKIAANQVLEALRGVEGAAEPNSSDEGEIPQLDVTVDRQTAWAAGVGIGAVASTLGPLFSGFRATQWEDPLGYSHDVVLVYPDSMRVSAEMVANIPVPSTSTDARGAAIMVPLSQIADIKAGVGPQQIQRRNLERQISVNAGALPGNPVGDVADRAQKAIEELRLPAGYHTTFGGEVQNLRETKGYVLEAIILAVVFIYLILASLFGSFFQPLAIMLALPLSFIGVGLALLVTKGNLNVISMIGIIMLMGLVTKNGILLIDFANQQRAAGTDREQALLVSGRIRLRPIIMTTVAMIFGMLPLAFAIGEGAEQRAPMARAVIGGLMTSTLLTLFVVPVVYTLLDDMVKVRIGGLLLRKSPRQAGRPEPEPLPAGGD
jgi:hydrophobic/amphiphilic exporter-1 (mainly G- bacteria), HAE1 family